MKKSLLTILLIALPLLTACGEAEVKPAETKVVTGADVLLTNQLGLVANKNIGIVTNHTGVLSNGVHIADTLHKLESVNVVALFGPEHGIRGKASAGEKIEDGTDKKTGLPVYSLYGKNRKPTPEMVEGIDLIVFDIQDVGARFYTYISTLYNVIEACAEYDIPLLVLDRPNPINGVDVEGPLRTEELKSFVAIAPVPIRHGMTMGELALMFNDLFITTDKKADIGVVEMNGWKRDYFYDDCGFEWVPPSPNIPDLETAVVYPGVCFIEGTNISEGRGTHEPFMQVGAPFIDAEKLAAKLRGMNIAGIEIDTVTFTPVSIPDMSKYPKNEDETCYGVKFKVTDKAEFASVEFGVRLLTAIKDTHPKEFKFKENNWIDKLFGNTYLRKMLTNGYSADSVIEEWAEELTVFKNARKEYLLY